MEKNDDILKVDELKMKSEFEMKIIESFKNVKVINSYELLSQAFEKLPKYIEEIKNYLLN